MKFQPGQELVCINTQGWFASQAVNGEGKKVAVMNDNAGPAFDEIVHVEEYHERMPNHIALKEYPRDSALRRQYYDAKFFEAVPTTAEINLALDLKPETWWQRMMKSFKRSKGWL